VRCLIAGPAVFICDECVALCDDIVEDEKIQNLLTADEASGQGYPTTTEHLRTKSTAQLAHYAEHSPQVAAGHRLELNLIRQMLALRDGEAPPPDLLASPAFARLKDKTREDLLARAQDAERKRKGFEDALRIATAVLDARGQ
jgi:hypothetical protein